MQENNNEEIETLQRPQVSKGGNNNVIEKTDDEERGITLGQIWHMIIKHWIAVVICMLIGLAVGAVMHGYVPQAMFIKYLGAENPFAVPLAAIAGIPIYANHDSVLPIVQVLLLKGVPLGTTLVMLMSITAISLPEMIMLNKVLSWRMLGLFVGYLFISFIFVGYIMNFIL